MLSNSDALKASAPRLPFTVPCVRDFCRSSNAACISLSDVLAASVASLRAAISAARSLASASAASVTAVDTSVMAGTRLAKPPCKSINDLNVA